MKVRALKLKNVHFGNQWRDTIENRWEYDDFQNSPEWRTGWISFDCLCHDPLTDTVFCGITSFDADIFHGWNRREGKWFNPGYARIRDPYDAKFHRSLIRCTGDGYLYASQALLHDIDRFRDAPGASIVRYNPGTGDIAKLAVPMPHAYIQSLVLDEARDTLYGQTFTPENLISYNLRTGESRCLGPTSSGMTMAQGENLGLDDNGGVWGVWAVTRAWQCHPGADQYRFYRYNPLTDKLDYMNKGLPRQDGDYGYARPEAFFNFGTGCLYVSGDGGALYRLDPKTGDAEFLFRAIDSKGRGRRSRLAAMALAPDGCAYGVCGRDGQCEILKFNPATEAWELFGLLNDGAEAAWQIHDVCITPDGVIYAAENDNPRRSGYLWEINL